MQFSTSSILWSGMVSKAGGIVSVLQVPLAFVLIGAFFIILLVAFIRAIISLGKGAGGR